jgi:ribosomal protein S8
MTVKIIIETGLIQSRSYYQAHNNKSKFSNLLKQNKEGRNSISTITEVN